MKPWPWRLNWPPKERLQLIERVASSVEQEMESLPSSVVHPTEHWGQSLVRLLDELGPIEMKYPEMEDSVEWVQRIRQDERQHRLGDWGEDE
jgi:formate dehydrogenase maturation protein FdhE